MITRFSVSTCGMSLSSIRAVRFKVSSTSPVRVAKRTNKPLILFSSTKLPWISGPIRVKSGVKVWNDWKRVSVKRVSANVSGVAAIAASALLVTLELMMVGRVIAMSIGETTT